MTSSDNKPSFGDRLVTAVQKKQTPLMVGIDPRWERMPDGLLGDLEAADDPETRASVFERFGKLVIDAVADLVPAVKPQSAFFEQLGPAGMSALSRVVDYAVQRELLVIMDAKRGDIGSTAEAYAAAFLGRKPESAWGCDALTVNPYLGGDSLTPFVDRCLATGAGIFVLVKTSNPGSDTLQNLVVEDGTPVYRHTAAWIQRLADESQGASGYGAVGAVVGATYPEQLSELRSAMPNTVFLIPGFGAQGGTAVDVAGGFDQRGLGAIVNSSRGIIFAYEQPQYQKLDWQDAVHQAAHDAIAALASDTPAGRLLESE